MGEVWTIAAAAGAAPEGELACRRSTSGAKVLWRVEFARANAAGGERGPSDDGAAHRDVECPLPCGAHLRVRTDSDRVLPLVDRVDVRRRRWRESWESALDVLLYVARGTASARVSDEEEAFELDAGEALWLEDPPPGAEVDLVGGADDTLVVALAFQRVE